MRRTQTHLAPIPRRNRFGAWILGILLALFFCLIMAYFTIVAVPVAAAGLLSSLYLFVWRRRELTGACPRCGTSNTVARVVRRFDCSSCHAPVTVRGVQFVARA